MEKPAERIHFLEYGILGILIFKATGKEIKQNIFAIILLVTIAVIDESIQYMLPNRVGDIRDIVMNLTGGVIGLWLGKFWYQS
ncbi:MAG: VanZ family protein [Candidatus Desulfofervidus auxilii]|nr:VanZ family protein [Candidatus Desulfofervidus auxilii]